MSEQADELKRRTKIFALDVMALLRTLPATDEAKTVGRQLLRACSGVASNYRAACRSRSRPEFAARIGVALEEADESGLWLELLVDAGISRSREVFRLLIEANELSAIFAASSITARRPPES